MHFDDIPQWFRTIKGVNNAIKPLLTMLDGLIQGGSYLLFGYIVLWSTYKGYGWGQTYFDRLDMHGLAIKFKFFFREYNWEGEYLTKKKKLFSIYSLCVYMRIVHLNKVKTKM